MDVTQQNPFFIFQILHLQLYEHETNANVVYLT